MKGFYFFRTRKLINFLVNQKISNKTLFLYFIYLGALFFAYHIIPSILFQPSHGKILGKHGITIFLQVMICVCSFLVISKKISSFRNIDFAKSYIAIYSTEALTFFIVRILITSLFLLAAALLNVNTSPGFAISHYPNLFIEIASTGLAELTVQTIMAFRFTQIKNRSRE